MGETEVKIILLSDIMDQRERRLKELEFYSKKKEELERKLLIIQKDLALTDILIKMITKENSANSLSII